MALGNAAVHQDGDAAAALVRLKPDQVAGAGDAGFSAEMGDGDVGGGHCQVVWFWLSDQVLGDGLNSLQPIYSHNPLITSENTSSLIEPYRLTTVDVLKVKILS
jgi:hypothetical protein